MNVAHLWFDNQVHVADTSENQVKVPLKPAQKHVCVFVPGKVSLIDFNSQM
jgi:hypothetical protein